MTDTAREAAIERVRDWVAENADKPDDYDTRDGDILLGDLRLLLTDPRQPSEAPVTADEGWRPPELDAALNNRLAHAWGLTLQEAADSWSLMLEVLPAPPTGEGGGL